MHLHSIAFNTIGHPMKNITQQKQNAQNLANLIIIDYAARRCRLVYKFCICNFINATIALTAYAIEYDRPNEMQFSNWHC